MKDLHGADVLDVDDAAGLSFKLIVEQRARGGGDLDESRLTLGFHAAGEVDGVTPEIVGEFFGADYAADDRAAVEADADGPA